jgi:hypothetical protein
MLETAVREERRERSNEHRAPLIGPSHSTQGTLASVRTSLQRQPPERAPSSHQCPRRARATHIGHKHARGKATEQTAQTGKQQHHWREAAKNASSVRRVPHQRTELERFAPTFEKTSERANTDKQTKNRHRKASNQEEGASKQERRQQRPVVRDQGWSYLANAL